MNNDVVFPLHLRVQTGSRAHPTSCPMSISVSYPGRKADHSSPSSAEAKNAWSCISRLPLYLRGVCSY